jgi:membrane protease YdiL (CAAX protease family)
VSDESPSDAAGSPSEGRSDAQDSRVSDDAEGLPHAQVIDRSALGDAHQPRDPSRVPKSYVARILATVWLCSAALYGTSRIDVLSNRQSHTAMACYVVLALFLLLRGPAFRHWLWDVTLGQWPKIDAETERSPGEAGTFQWKVVALLVLVAVSLTIQEYIGDRGYFDKTFTLPPYHPFKLGAVNWPSSWGVQSHFRHYYELASFAWWSSWRVIGYVVMPTVFILCWPRERVRDYHVSFHHFFKHLWIYVFLFLCVLPAVLYASTTIAFRHTYPFYRLANRSHTDLWIWESLYAAQFVALEFFFRGFILRGLRRVMGSNAVFVMIVPYCMIHYGKPLPETLGAIFAGLILGTMAIRTKSIWGGVLIHIGVAITMDILALRGCPTLPNTWCGE